MHSPLVVREWTKWKEETTSAKALRWEHVWYKELHVAGEEQAGWGDGWDEVQMMHLEGHSGDSCFHSEWDGAPGSFWAGEGLDRTWVFRIPLAAWGNRAQAQGRKQEVRKGRQRQGGRRRGSRSVYIRKAFCVWLGIYLTYFYLLALWIYCVHFFLCFSFLSFRLLWSSFIFVLFCLMFSSSFFSFY